MRSIFKAILIAIVFFIAYSGLGETDESATQYVTVSVARGDTVWGIAGKYAGNHQDIRDIVYDIQKVNNLNKNAELEPGQQLKVPIKKLAK